MKKMNQPKDFYLEKFKKRSNIRPAISLCFCKSFYEQFKEIEINSDIVRFRMINPGFSKITIHANYNKFVILIHLRMLMNGNVEIYTGIKSHPKLIDLFGGTKHHKRKNIILVDSIKDIFSNINKLSETHSLRNLLLSFLVNNKIKIPDYYPKLLLILKD